MKIEEDKIKGNKNDRSKIKVLILAKLDKSKEEVVCLENIPTVGLTLE